MPRCHQCHNSRDDLIRPIATTGLSETEMCADCYGDRYFVCNGCGMEERASSGYQEPTEASVFQLCRDCISSINNGSTTNNFGASDCPTPRERVCDFCDSTAGSQRRVAGGRRYSTCTDCWLTNTDQCSGCSTRHVNSDLTSRDLGDFCYECLRSNTWDNHGFYTENPSYEEIRSHRKYGIELETSRCDDYKAIRGNTVFGCKPDGSVDGMEFVSPVLYGDEGLEETRKICDFARDYGWRVDSSCGLHLHLDLSNESNENCYKVLRAYMYTYEFWTSFISNSRKANYYCAKQHYGEADLVYYEADMSFRDWVSTICAGERYQWVNFNSYNRFKTVELRHHAGSLNAEKITNWVKAHTRFIDAVVALPVAEIVRLLKGKSTHDQLAVIAGWWDDTALTEHYRERAAHFRKPFRNPNLIGAN